MSSDKAQARDEENVLLPEVEEGNEAKQSYIGIEEGEEIRVWINQEINLLNK